ncbi:transporter substrate-binding domain-containing protein [Haematospirillum sp. H1815]|uniref:substrate-binding periplasmic protein n=1 Tax=Haematospirillum sp. H1815 TaxID=2723108 RepID=UPI00143BB89C|nr:transporter substrate-binding domain-containing protein [Haematospirillum sp. H1815]NKD76549.1 transporter substrate-binding domain-containing protein [Haematospirillum sp. H1815]
MLKSLYGAAVSLAVILNAGGVQAQTFVFNTEEWYPYSYSSRGTFVGTATEIVRLMAENAGIAYTIAVHPRARSYSMTTSKNFNCSFPVPLSDEYSKRLKWIAPIEMNRWVVYKKKDSTLALQNLGDLKGKTIGGYVGGSVSAYVKSLGLKVNYETVDDANPRKLEEGSIDVWATTEFSALTLARKAGVEIEEAFEIEKNIMGIACNNNIDDLTIDRLQQSLNALNNSGEADAIRRSKF